MPQPSRPPRGRRTFRTRQAVRIVRTSLAMPHPVRLVVFNNCLIIYWLWRAVATTSARQGSCGGGGLVGKGFSEPLALGLQENEVMVDDA